MTKIRVGLFILTIVVVSIAGYFVSLYARGYRLNPTTYKVEPRGLLVTSSDPDGASIYINGELKSATRATLSLSPGTYDTEIRKDGYLTWKKRLVIEKEVVTTIQVSLFPSAPSLTAQSFSGAFNPTASDDLTKVAYAVPASKDNDSKTGLWVIELVNLPFGFNREAFQVTDGALDNAKWEWSPDTRQIMLTIGSSVYLLDAGKFTSQTQRVNISSKKESVLADWKEKRANRTTAKLGKLTSALQDIFKASADSVVFSPDENKIMYTAISDSTIPTDIIPQLPGASTQKQVRDVKRGKKYIYDIKEDRNFEIGDATQVFYWLPTSEHVIFPEPNKITIMEYDATNRQVIYSGQYQFPVAFPYSNGSRLLILSNLGATGNPQNLYSLTLK